MPFECAIHALLNCGKMPTEIVAHLGVSRVTIYGVKRSNTIERKPGSGCKAKLNPKVFKEMAEATPLKTMAAHARDLEVSEMTIRSEKGWGKESWRGPS